MNRDFDLFRKSQGISGVAMHDFQNHINNVYAHQFQGNAFGYPQGNQFQGSGYINPSIIEERQLNVASMDVFSRLMMDRIVFLGTGIDDTVSNIIVGQLLYLQSVDSTKNIDLYLNSPGGGVYAGLAIRDTMEFIKPDVNTMVTGMAASMGYVLAVSGKHRSALRHSRLMQHQPLGGASGQAADILITAEQIKKVGDELYKIIAERTKQPFEKIKKDCDRDYWMTSEEAKAYGAIDHVVGIDG